MTGLNLIAKLKSKNNPIDFTVACFLTLGLYLSITAESKIIWICISSVLFLRLLNKPMFLLMSLSILLIAMLLNMLFAVNTHTGHIVGNFEVKEKLTGSIVVKYKGELISVKTKKDVNLYDQVYISGDLSPIKNYSDFDYVTYMKSKNIFSQISYSYIKVLSQSSDIRTKAIKFLSEGPENYKKVAPLMLLGKKTADSASTYELAFNLSVIHLFVISGFHISLFFVCFYKLLTKMKIDENSAQIIGLIPIGAYLLLLNFPLSATRASLLIFLSVMNNVLFKKKFKTIELLGVVLMSLFLWNRNGIYSISFIFTFIATYVIIYLNGLKYKNKWFKYICLSIGAYASNLPISIYLNGFFSAFGLFYSMILSPIFVFMYVVSLVLFPFKNVMNYIYGTFIYLLNTLNEFNIMVNIKKPPIIFIQSLYFLPLLCLIINMKWNLFGDKKAISLTEKLKN